MKKIFLLGCLILITACQTATPTPTPFPSQTVTLLPPTPIPDTQTPEPTPNLEFTPTPLPRFFTNQFDSSLAGWVILQAGNDSVPNISTENSVLRLQMDSPYIWLYVLYGAHDYEDTYVETQFTNSALSPASIGLVCRYDEEDGWLEYNVSTDGTYNVLYGQWLANGIADYLPILDGTSKEIGQSGETQRIGLTCKGTTLQLYINDNIIRSVDVTRYELTEGKVGLTASSFENTPVLVAFDFVTVSEP
jgi:hypothetical protein